MQLTKLMKVFVLDVRLNLLSSVECDQMIDAQTQSEKDIPQI